MIDYSDLKLIDFYEYDITPNEKGEMMIVFKVEEGSYMLPISIKSLKEMLWFAKQNRLRKERISMSKLVIGDKIRTKAQGFYRNKSLVTKYCPQIQVNGEFAMLKDDTTESGIAECDTRKEARERARQARDDAKARWGGEGADTE